MMRVLIALLCGALFSTGLIVSGMTDTKKVQGFLDLFGSWDPTLIFVMGGAIIPMLIAWQITKVQKAPAFAVSFPSAPDASIDKQLAMGSVLFGIGWGLSGFCPGPAMASLTFGGLSGAVFFSAMGLGMIAQPPIRRVLAL